MRRAVIAILVAGALATAASDLAAGAPVPPEAPAPPTPTTAPPPAPPTTVPPVVDESGGVSDAVTGGGAPVPATLPLIPEPIGCDAPALPHIVFVGRVVNRDYRTVRFEIGRIRAGRGEPFAAGNLIDIRYGLDAQYLVDGERYLVSGVVDPVLGLLVSRVTEPTDDFGGDEVIGVSESDVNCPRYENPVRTLHLDGTPVESTVVGPFFDAKVDIAVALLLPTAIAFGIIFLLSMLRLSATGLVHAVTGTSGRRRPRGA